MKYAVLSYDGTIAPITFAAEQLKQALKFSNIEVKQAGSEDLSRSEDLSDTSSTSGASLSSPSLSGASETIRIILTTEDALQEDVGSLPFLAPQGYAIRMQYGHYSTGNRLGSSTRNEQDNSKVYNAGNGTEEIVCWVIGADVVGAMYGGLDVAEALRTGTPLRHIRNHHKNPFIAKRGIKFNIPLDARTPSYSDNGDSAQHNINEMWSKPFWEEYLDEMALHRFNTLSLWNLHPFPSMVQVPEYPDVALQDVKKTTAAFQATLRGLDMSTADTLNHLVTLKEMTMAEKIAFWRDVMQYAQDRGIEVYIITWNIFTYGTEGNGYGINNEQNNETTIDYFRASVRSLLETYPLLAGIGVTAGENMQHLGSPYSDEEWLWRTYGEAVLDVKRKQPERHVHFIHRAHETSLATIDNAFEAYSDTFSYSYKYSLAHMYASVNPPFIHKEGFIHDLPNRDKTWLTVRDDDFYYFRWGNPEFARQYILNMPPADQLAGFLMGPDGLIWGREFVSTEPESPRQLIIKKLWYSFSIWGRLSYDPTLPDQLFQKQLAFHYPEVPPQLLFEAWASASKIIPTVTTFHWQGNSLDFQWYPEACYSHPQRAKGFHSVQHFIEDAPMDGSGMMSIPAYCDHLLEQKAQTGITPIQVAQDLQAYAFRTQQLLMGIGGVTGKELRLLLGDLEALSYLGQYYALKIMGAVELCLYQKSAASGYQDNSVGYLRQASVCWKRFAAITTNQYIPQYLTRQGAIIVDVTQLQAQVDRDIWLAEVLEG
ncbi:carbohydrate-binding family 6 protein [Paenibacillus agricola]|uniref:Carbohydrate-binding family 6 protein n=1 Tax=Paenibacillus agricola TaxID=2716264 RepID=A0ABX0J8G5_9BACL|nr:carbohydrate-binding family 6 protein [Paenibacillus agricola]NHN31474.1 carbohydrate-binding family 6 protein [Paenibacillus agricola]